MYIFPPSRSVKSVEHLNTDAMVSNQEAGVQTCQMLCDGRQDRHHALLPTLTRE